MTTNSTASSVVRKPNRSSVSLSKKTSTSAKRSRYSSGIVSTYIGAFLLIITLVSLGYQPTSGKGEVGMVSDASATGTPVLSSPSVDEAIAVAVAGSIAERANLPVASNAAELSVALAVKSELAQTGDETTAITKPQIVEPDASSRDIRTHVVKSGDTVGSVAREYGLSETTVRWANNLTGNSLRKGKKLTIPPSDGVIYTVKSGDTIDSLAKKYSADKTRIVTFNDLEITGLKKGKKILIPSGSLPTTERPGYVAPPQTTVASTPASSGATANFMAGSVGNRYAYGYCTWYVYERREASGRPIGSFWGNAYSWAAAASSQGYKVNSTPAPGAVMQTSSGGGGYGHVAYVESVDAKGNVTVREMNYAGWNVISSRTISAGQAQGYRYIH